MKRNVFNCLLKEKREIAVVTLNMYCQFFILQALMASIGLKLLIKDMQLIDDNF